MFCVWVLCTIHKTYKPLFLAKFSLKMGPTTLFTHLKIILLQCFQFSVSAKISCIRLDKTYFAETKNKKHCSKIIFKCVNSVVGPIFNEKVAEK